MLEVYREVCEDVLSYRVSAGQVRSEKFPGAVDTYTNEGSCA